VRSKVWIIAAALALSSCAGTSFIPTHTVYKVIKPDDTYLQCHLRTTLPDASTLKDSEVAQLLNDVYADNKTCYNNIMSLKQFYSAADQIFKDTNKAPKQ